AKGEPWTYFTHDQARSRTYRWGEDGIAGICDRHCAICFAPTFWNGHDPILKERLFGLGGPEGNHGEDCKELYFYLDNTPTHSYMKYLYKYPHKGFPYQDLYETNRRRTKRDLEYELLDTEILKEDAYFDIYIEYAKAADDDILIRITAHNRGKEPAPLYILPTVWMRNLWTFNQMPGYHRISAAHDKSNYGSVKISHPKLQDHFLHFESPQEWLFTDNETNRERLWGAPNFSPYVKDLFHDTVIKGDYELTRKRAFGTKFAPLHQLNLPAGGSQELRLRLSTSHFAKNPLRRDFERGFEMRMQEANEFYEAFFDRNKVTPDQQEIQRQAFAGLMWTKQYYNIDMETWMQGDPGLPPPPPSRKKGRNRHWMTLNNEDIISMPDKWEYPWYAAWDLAFHCVPIARIDPDFAKEQLILITREWYMSPSGQIPAYEWSFSDVNPPVQAWAALQIFQLEESYSGRRDIHFLKRIFNKLTLNFTWWVNRKDSRENNVFEGGFLGLDNIGVFDRSSEIPGDGVLEQADGTAWMALFALNMLQIAVEIAQEDKAYEDMATKYFEHFVYIAESLNKIGDDWVGSWDEQDGFFYDLLVLPNDEYVPIKIRSLVGLMTLNAVAVLSHEKTKNLRSFSYGLRWFRNYRRKHGKYLVIEEMNRDEDILLSLVPRKRMIRLLHALFDQREFLSDYGIRALSKIHQDPYVIKIGGREFSVSYDPAESSSYLYGGNSNWRGPIWIPMNFLLVRALQEYDKYYKEDLKVEFPVGSGEFLTLGEAAKEIGNRLISIFEKDEHGDRPVHALHAEQYRDPHFKDLVLFYEYFHGDSGRGVGASHQTGWTGLIAELIAEL
ncbi:MAG: glucosidase, partial [Saprospiraceae bacterium]|nr:glucosidase [Saprospiraceae bacterium]